MPPPPALPRKKLFFHLCSQFKWMVSVSAIYPNQKPSFLPPLPYSQPPHPIEHSSSQSLYASFPFPLPLLCSSHHYISPRSLWCLVMFWSLCDFSKTQSDLLSSCLKLFNVSPSQAPKEKRKLSIPLVPAHHPDFTNNQYNLCHHLGEIIWPFVPCF